MVKIREGEEENAGGGFGSYIRKKTEKGRKEKKPRNKAERSSIQLVIPSCPSFFDVARG